VPTYGYRCEQGHEFDVWQRMSDEAKADCPVCGSAGKRLFFPAGIVFKGGGFYKTDSRKSSTAASAGSDNSSSSGSSPSSSPSTPSTPSSPSTPPSSSPTTPSSSSTAASAAD
jgi:putative FmdB family regulatory protein